MKDRTQYFRDRRAHNREAVRTLERRLKELETMLVRTDTPPAPIISQQECSSCVALRNKVKELEESIAEQKEFGQCLKPDCAHNKQLLANLKKAHKNEDLEWLQQLLEKI